MNKVSTVNRMTQIGRRLIKIEDEHGRSITMQETGDPRIMDGDWKKSWKKPEILLKNLPLMITLAVFLIIVLGMLIHVLSYGNSQP